MLIEIISTIIIGLISWIIYSRQRFNSLYGHIPGPGKDNIIFGCLLNPLLDDLDTFTNHYSRKYGPIWLVSYGIFAAPLVIGTTPEVTKEFTVIESKGIAQEKPDWYAKLNHIFGDRSVFTTRMKYWKKPRKLMEPTFYTKNLLHRQKQIDHCILVSMRSFAKRSLSMSSFDDTTKVFDIDTFSSRLTLNFISQVLFGISIRNLPESFLKDIEMNIAEAMNVAYNPFRTWTQWLPLPSNFAHRKSIAAINDYTLNLIKERTAKLEERIAQGKTQSESELENEPFLDQLLSATDKEGNGFTEAEIWDNVRIIFYAGIDTTAHSLGFTIRRLAENREVEAKVIEEIDSVFGERDTIPIEELGKLKYLDAVIKETMRLDYVAVGIDRYTDQDIELAGVKIPAGTDVSFSLAVCAHTNPLYWSDPTSFNPDRWLDTEAIKSRHPYAFVPFGVGFRSCVGRNLALLELRAFLAHFYRFFIFRGDPAWKFTIKASFTQRPGDHGNKVLVHPRPGREDDIRRFVGIDPVSNQEIGDQEQALETLL